MSLFLHDLKHIKARNCLLRIRLGVSQLRSHWFRFARNAEADLACPFCNYETESEVHFILSCPMYNDLRDKYIPRKYVRCPSLFKLSMLFYFWKQIPPTPIRYFSTQDFWCTQFRFVWTDVVPVSHTLIWSCLTVFFTTVDMGPRPFSINRSDSDSDSLSLSMNEPEQRALGINNNKIIK